MHIVSMHDDLSRVMAEEVRYGNASVPMPIMEV